MQITVNTENELPEAAKTILKFAGNERLFLLDGEMGSGKTTLIKELCRQLGSTDNFSSPTYSIVNEYNSSSGKIYHFDLYRLKNVEELMDIGIEEYIYSGNYCFFEWPELLKETFNLIYIILNIHKTHNRRYIRALKHTNIV